MTMHEVPLERRTLHGHFSRDLEPVLFVDPGDSVAFAVPNAGWRLESRERFEPFDEELDAGHALIGPIDVRGARSGGTLVVGVDEVEVGSWGVTFGDGEAFEWRLEGSTGVDEGGRRVELRPFLGVLGMPPPEPGRFSTAPPRRWGGNVDCKELVAGATLYLPIPVDGARFSAGDGHAAQGDGEVSGTAIECPISRAVLTLGLSDLELRAPIARTADAWLTFGFDADLDVAVEQATETMLDLLERELEVERPHALALASVAVDLRVTQVVNGVKGIHAVLRDGAIR